MDEELLDKIKKSLKSKKNFNVTWLQLEFEIGYPQAREILDLLIEEGLVKVKDEKTYNYQGERYE